MTHSIVSSAVLLSVFLLACGVPGPATDSLDPAAFADRIGKNDAQLVDVRTSAEFSDGHIDGSLNLDWNGGQLEQRATELDMRKPVLLYCASGRRSAAARDYLREQGFNNVVDLAGGINAWTEAGKPVRR